jgi:hypothetical protein
LIRRHDWPRLGVFNPKNHTSSSSLCPILLALPFDSKSSKSSKRREEPHECAVLHQTSCLLVVRLRNQTGSLIQRPVVPPNQTDAAVQVALLSENKTACMLSVRSSSRFFFSSFEESCDSSFFERRDFEERIRFEEKNHTGVSKQAILSSCMRSGREAV